MFRYMLKSKLHGATLTKTVLNYSGSIGIDAVLLKESDIIAGERVQVLNFNTGERIETYTIAEDENSGIIALYGPAARCGQQGDKLAILSYAMIPDNTARALQAKVIIVGKNNTVHR